MRRACWFHPDFSDRRHASTGYWNYRSVRCAAFYLMYWLFLSVSGQEWQHHGSAFFCWKTGTRSRTSGCTDNTLTNSQKDHYLQWQFLWPSFSQKTVRNKSYQSTIFRYSVGGSVPGSLSSEEPDSITGLQTEIHWNLSRLFSGRFLYRQGTDHPVSSI